MLNLAEQDFFDILISWRVVLRKVELTTSIDNLGTWKLCDFTARSTFRFKLVWGSYEEVIFHLLVSLLL